MSVSQINDAELLSKVKSIKLYIILYSILPALYFIIYLVPFIYLFIKSLNESGYTMEYTALTIIYILFLTFVLPWTIYSIVYIVISLVNLNIIHRNLKTLKSKGEYDINKFRMIADDIGKNLKIIKILRTINTVIYVILLGLVIPLLGAMVESYSNIFIIPITIIVVLNVLYIFIINLNKLDIRIPFEFKNDNEKTNSWDSHKY